MMYFVVVTITFILRMILTQLKSLCIEYFRLYCEQEMTDITRTMQLFFATDRTFNACFETITPCFLGIQNS